MRLPAFSAVVAEMLDTLLLWGFLSNGLAATVLVPGTSDPWLAGMPDGATASLGDTAPAHSPVPVVGIPIIPGTALTFTVSGGVGYHPLTPLDGPDGNPASYGGHFPGFPAPENGIANCVAPADALLGVFLGPDIPTLTPAPIWLDFGTPESRQYRTLAPLVKQVFFIGDGHTADGVSQQILVPSGATRFFLGTMDGSGWYNNVGAFTASFVIRQRLEKDKQRLLGGTLLVVGPTAKL